MALRLPLTACGHCDSKFTEDTYGVHVAWVRLYAFCFLRTPENKENECQ
jgi:hypothetical protein